MSIRVGGAGFGRRRLGRRARAGDVPADRTSAWLITINTNRAAYTDAELEAVEDDLQRVGELMTDPENIEDILIFRQPGYGMENIKNIDREASVEIGDHFGRIHQHVSACVPSTLLPSHHVVRTAQIVLEITHTIPHPSLFLNVPAIKRFYRANGRTAAVQNTAYVWVRWFQSKATLLRYLAGAKRRVGDPA